MVVQGERVTCGDATLTVSGRGSAWLERLVRDQEVGGSNPLAPTIFPLSFVGFSPSGQGRHSRHRETGAPPTQDRPDCRRRPFGSLHCSDTRSPTSVPRAHQGGAGSRVRTGARRERGSQCPSSIELSWFVRPSVSRTQVVASPPGMITAAPSPARNQSPVLHPPLLHSRAGGGAPVAHTFSGCSASSAAGNRASV